MSLVPVVVLQVVERMVVPDPRFDDHTPIPLSRGFKEFLDPWSDLLVDEGLQGPEVVLVVRQRSQMKVGMECKDLSTMIDHWFSFLEENQGRTSRGFRKVLEGFVQE